MCFLLYAGTLKSIPRLEWNQNARDLSVRGLLDGEKPIRQHFSRPEVQYIGSTTGCGCGFPNVMEQNGEWPYWQDPNEVRGPDDVAEELFNREGLVRLLRSTGEDVIELYVIWAGASGEPPHIREEIELSEILKSDFRFKEFGSYRVKVPPAPQ
jgi:hypothetical protein